MQILMSKGSAGEDVERLRQALVKVLGADAAPFPSLQATGTPIDEDFDAAIRRWQAGVGLIADGVVGPRCQQLLDLLAIDTGKLELTLNVGNVSRLFPATKPANIARYLPYIEAALGVAELTDRAMILGALGTIRSETEGFVPIAEAPSKFNTPPGGPPFSLYDKRASLGNSQPGDGERYRGRGFVQLTGKDNYTRYGGRIGVPLDAAPDRANAPEVAAVLLALYLADKATKFRQAVRAGDLAQARKLVNGGAHGLDRFKDVFDRAATVWPQARAGSARRGAAAAAAEPQTPTERAAVSRTRKDTADLRDRVFQPSAISLPDEFPPADEVRQYLPAYTRAGLILDQGREGACTGFGLSCVINYLRWVKSSLPAKLESVSPRMLYTLARRHDEYEGENYEGSSCRGALKGWFNHGVCLEPDWPYLPEKSNPATYGFAGRASQNTLGVYYRVDTTSITDLQAAIAQHRAVFVSAFTHAGWNAVPMTPAPKNHAELPLIAFDGRRSQTGGHAFALIGFNAQGFILQNSWGKGWGAGGFAVLGYLDWLANAMDAWVVALGVPGVIAGRLAVGGVGAAAALSGADRSKWWDTGLAYQHSVVLGNDGRVSRYLTEDEQPRKLQQQACVLPDAWFRQQQAATKRLVLYVHGGLNSEEEAIKRASAMGRYFAGNGCYPLFLVWKTGLLESIGNLIADAFRAEPARAGAGIGEWISERTDLLIEKSVGRPLARPLWSEMKENAELAFAARRGGDLLLDAMQALAANWDAQFELHLVGHSAGAIAIGHLLGALAERQRAGRDGGLGGRVASISLYAPACSVAFANRHYAGDAARMARLHLDVLSDPAERADTVGPIYRKSLLYLVSNALEADLHTPILGLDRINDPVDSGWDGSSDTGEALALWRQAAEASKLEARTRRVQGPRIEVALDAGGQPVLERPAHGAFDNDIEVMTRTLERITGAKLAVPVDDLRGF